MCNVMMRCIWKALCLLHGMQAGPLLAVAWVAAPLRRRRRRRHAGAARLPCRRQAPIAVIAPDHRSLRYRVLAQRCTAYPAACHPKPCSGNGAPAGVPGPAGVYSSLCSPARASRNPVCCRPAAGRVCGPQPASPHFSKHHADACTHSGAHLSQCGPRRPADTMLSQAAGTCAFGAAAAAAAGATCRVLPHIRRPAASPMHLHATDGTAAVEHLT